MTTASTRVPAALQGKFAAITQLTDAFCDLRLDDEYQQMIRLAAAALCRKRPSPVLKGTEAAWSAALVHAVGAVNFLFDASQTPHCKAADIQTHFGVSASNGAKRAREVRDALDMGPMSPEWTLPSRLDRNPMVWMLEVNGLMVDARQLPLEVQEIAFKQLLQEAARAAHKNVSEFLLDAGIIAANQMLADRLRFELPPEQWEAFQAALDQPVTERPKLSKLLREPGLLG